MFKNIITSSSYSRRRGVERCLRPCFTKQLMVVLIIQTWVFFYDYRLYFITLFTSFFRSYIFCHNLWWDFFSSSFHYFLWTISINIVCITLTNNSSEVILFLNLDIFNQVRAFDFEFLFCLKSFLNFRQNIFKTCIYFFEKLKINWPPLWDFLSNFSKYMEENFYYNISGNFILDYCLWSQKFILQ